MAFNPSNYKPIQNKIFPVMMILDIGWETDIEKVEYLNIAISEVIDSLRRQSVKDIIIYLSIITFQGNAVIYIPFMSVNELINKKINDLELIEFIMTEGAFLGGGIYLDEVIKLAKSYIEDREMFKDSIYKPVVVMALDHISTDNCEISIEKFISSGRTKFSQRFAIAMGENTDINLLSKFTKGSGELFCVNKPSDIVDSFQNIIEKVFLRINSEYPNDILDSGDSNIIVNNVKED